MEHHTRHRAVRFPGVADLAREIGGVPSLAPVPFVGIQARFELAAEERPEARGEMHRCFRRDKPLDDEEAVFAESCDLRWTWIVDEKHGHSQARGANRFRMLRASRIISRQSVVQWIGHIQDKFSHAHVVLQPG